MSSIPTHEKNDENHHNTVTPSSPTSPSTHNSISIPTRNSSAHIAIQAQESSNHDFSATDFPIL